MVKTHWWAVAIKYPNGWDRFKMLNSTNKLKSLGLRDPGNWRDLSLMKGSGWEPHHLRLPPKEVSSPSLGVFKQVQRATYGQGKWQNSYMKENTVFWTSFVKIPLSWLLLYLNSVLWLSHCFNWRIYFKRKTVRIIWASLVVLLVKKKWSGVKRSERGSVLSDSLRPHGLSMKVESEKVGFKLNIQKMKIMASGPITSWEI